ncbi:phosphoribosylanthranilate isomerase [Natrarchaeobius halalkaliphilus]|uniref:N-(5'-phosphoribosyl)anthranilate isomerase n=1 Tax=Natrarchaeobius halalkaliphilus TaxID=1679091 RepID=A0A3N6M5V0_9EURY|nr:phosphoribosylanthranilate isomerase [Natrarchaeobius halalkaliphilus]RQG91400.1 phosphoribosylanthranilate isomerase [Natrarchaeobius halalkaliphilus]
MTRVKICGLTGRNDLETVVDAGADAVGVIVDVPVNTPREITADRAADLVATAPPFVTTVLVTMDRGLEHAADLVERVEPDVLQLHADPETIDIAAVTDCVDSQLVLAVDTDDVSSAQRHDGDVDAFLVDTPAEDGGGGTGRTHDWNRTRTAIADLESPVILAGGLTPANVAEAVRAADPFAVDVASGVEADGGVKDPNAVRSFVECARRAHGAEPTPHSS